VRSTLAARGRDTTLVGLELVHVARADSESFADDACELCAVVLDGTVDVTVGGAPVGAASRDGGVFGSPPVAVYVPPGDALELLATEDAVVAIASAPLDGETPGRARLIESSDDQVREAGTGNWARTIRTILGPDDDAGRLVLGETINPPGNWSSYPPHKHDRHAPPEEVALEEVYLYRFHPDGGFGVQLLYDDDGRERAQIVHDGDVVVIASGYHPVVAAPGYALYYLWVMAGEGRELAPYFDPKHAWVQERG
jgi:5-deoxy-glucuronate isomerase